MCLFTAPNALDDPVAARGVGAGGGMGGGFAPMEVGPPRNVKHVFHVTFDSAQGFVGLPPELQAQLEGLELEHAGQAAGDKAAESPRYRSLPALQPRPLSACEQAASAFACEPRLAVVTSCSSASNVHP